MGRESNEESGGTVRRSCGSGDGGAAGIGFATARAFADEGAQVVIVDIDEERLSRAAGELGVDSVLADVAREADVVEMVAAALDRHQQIDILVNLAGIYPRASIEEETLAGWKRLIEVNLDSTFLCCKHVLPPMSNAATGGSSTPRRERSTPGLPDFRRTSPRRPA